MAGKRTPPPLDLMVLAESWQITLESEGKSWQTVKSYLAGVNQFVAWCEAQGHEPELTKALARAWVAYLLNEQGVEPATARARQLGLRRFSAWLAEEDEIDSDPLLGLKAPALTRKVTQSLDDEQLRALIRACGGKELRDRRDEALVRLMAETGMRAGEVVALRVEDINLKGGVALVVRGKGGKGRIVPFSPQTARALDRYMRARRAHMRADSPELWLGERQKGLGYYGLHAALRDRAEKAGIAGFHPHLLRHTAASRWLAAGGSEGGLMAVAGWSTRDMIDRYTRSTAAERAATEARALNLGDL
jgi:site-specific recombinase XerD